MRKNWAFTLIELLVVISIIALLIGILLPALGAARRTARQMQNGTQLRGMQQAMVVFSQSNGVAGSGWYPGLNSSGQALGSASAVASTNYGYAADNAEASFALLLTGNYFVPAYMISPGETDGAIVAIAPVSTAGTVTTAAYSYTVSQANTAGTVGATATDAARRAEWRDNTNTAAIVLSDRCLTGTATINGTGQGTAATNRSIWTSVNGDWRGSIVFGDNSAQFLTTSVMTATRYSNTDTASDDIFVGVATDVNAKQWRN